MKNKILIILIIGLVLISGCIKTPTRTDFEKEEKFDKTPKQEIPGEENKLTECESCDFYRGKCGKEWSYCVQQGYDIKESRSCWDGAICVNKTTGEEIDTLANLLNLNEYGPVSLADVYCRKMGHNLRLEVDEEGEWSICVFSGEYCMKDDDCIKVPSGCCGCNMGGTNKAVNKYYYEPPNCTGMGCLAVMSDHWTCFAEPKCIDNTCKLIEDLENTCLRKWSSHHSSIVLIKFKEGLSEIDIEKILKPINEIEPKLDYRINFSFDIYTFNLPKEKTEYVCNYDYIWCYVKAIYPFFDYLNENSNVNAVVSGYEEISLIINNNKMNKEDVLNLINSYSDVIKIEKDDLSIRNNFYGFYVLPLVEEEIARYICNNLEGNENINSVEIMNIWLLELREIIKRGCTNIESFFPLPDYLRC